MPNPNPLAVATLPEPPNARSNPKPVNPDDLVRLWILRLVRRYLTSSRFLTPTRRGTRQNLPARSEAITGLLATVADITDTKVPSDCTDDNSAVKSVKSQIDRRIRRLARNLLGTPWLQAMPPAAGRSLAGVGQLIKLSDVKLRCLAFILMMKCNQNLEVACEAFTSSPMDMQGTSVLIAEALHLPTHEVGLALSGKSRLMASAVVRWDHSELNQLPGKFDWVTQGFPQMMMSPEFDPINALRCRIKLAPAPTVTWEQFAHLGDLQAVLLSHVRHSLNTKKRAVNILIHGAPGVGKSELTRTLAHKLECPLYEVSVEDEAGDSIVGGQRLQALRLLNGICEDQRSMIVFDEFEDVLPQPSFLSELLPRQSRPKGWLNQTLENNSAVTFWLTNAVSGMDPAIVRRFDLVLEIKNPPLSVLEEHLRQLPITLSAAAISKMASCAELTTAVVQRAASVLGSVQSELPPDKIPQIFERMVNQTLLAQGHKQLGPARSVADVYDLAFVNCDLDLEALATGIGQAKSARLCLFGPPGTGKTAYGRWLARQLGKPLCFKSASDLLSPLVGQAEKNIARAFEEAEASGAILLIDEVDSFLQDRRKAVRTWEVTQVNEFLTQIEQFEGVFIATTNLMEGLDAASLRRFDLKAKFDYLKPEQTQRLFAAHLKAVGLSLTELEAEESVAALGNLTPGDFSAVARQHRFRPLADASMWAKALISETKVKPQFHRPITGFQRK